MLTGFRRVKSERGYSLIELMLVVGILGVLGTMAIVQFNVAQPTLKGDGAMRVIMGQIRTARELAISERRYMRVAFTSPNKLEILREEVPGPTTVVKGQAILEGNVQFSLISSLSDTPDAFGKAARGLERQPGPGGAVDAETAHTAVGQIAQRAVGDVLADQRDTA